MSEKTVRLVQAAICCPRGCDALRTASEFAICQAHTWRDEAVAAVAAMGTLLASVDTLPKGQDAKQGLAGTEGSAVGEAETPNT